jgi:hypothetical protein
MADQDQPMVDPPAVQDSSNNQPLTETASNVENADTISKAPDTSEVLDSIEFESMVKGEDAHGDGQADSDAEGEDDEEQPADSSGRPVSNELYKALKAISDTLTEFKIKKGGE